MKKTILFMLLFISSIDGMTQPIVYFNFVTHNEETGQWNGNTYYTNNRLKLIDLANYFQVHGITWNLQSDWVYLSNVLTKETAALMATTNNKNILLWMQDDKGVEMDPHAHESQYIYPDVVKLMDSVGLAESKLMGGTIYNDSNGINIWTNLINGQHGNIFPNKFWQPDYMMGGGTPNHVNDLKYYGFWNPQSSTNYLTHDTTNHLRHIGVGCSIRIKDTSAVVNVVNQLKEFVQNVQTGVYAANGFYLQTIFFEQGDLNLLPFYNKVLAVADSVNAMVASGVASWKTLKQAYTQWETVYNAQMFQWECGQTVAVKENVSENAIRLFPNPATGYCNLDFNLTIKKPATFQLYNIDGEKIMETLLDENLTLFKFSTAELKDGMYFWKVSLTDGFQKTGKLVVKQDLY